MIAAGLALRLFGPELGLPFELTKYGGSVLWGSMVSGVVTAFRRGAGPSRAAAAATGVPPARAGDDIDEVGGVTAGQGGEG